MMSPAKTGAPPATQPLRPSALRRSALQRLGFVALPAAVLWLAVGFALDFWW